MPQRTTDTNQNSKTKKSEAFKEEELNVEREVYKNCTVAGKSAEIIMALSEEKSFENLLRQLKREYQELADEVQEKVGNAPLLPASEKEAAMIAVNAFFQNVCCPKTTKLAEMMIQGISMGEISVAKTLNQTAPDVPDHDAVKLLDLFSKHRETLKAYL